MNGGGAVTLQFQRNPFHPIKRTVVVPWNDIIVMPNPVVISFAPEDSDALLADPFNTGATLDMNINDCYCKSSHVYSFHYCSGVGVMIGEKRHNQSVWHCFAHDYDVMKPIVHETFRPGAQGGYTHNSAIIAETQASDVLSFLNLCVARTLIAAIHHYLT